jgi:hypothetical protein
MGISDLVELYRRGRTPQVPGEPVELADWDQLSGNSSLEILKSFFPEIGNDEILLDLEKAVDKLHPLPYPHKA